MRPGPSLVEQAARRAVGGVRRRAPWALTPVDRVRRGRRSAADVRNEHFVPTRGTELGPYLAAGDRLAVHHLIRYHWAVAVLADDPPASVVDVACGAGYGSAMLAAALPSTHVVGVDLDPAAVRAAAAHHHAANLSFQVGDLMRFGETISPDPVDCVVTFDTIEHVAHRELVLMGLVEHLSPTGRVLLSTPIRTSGVVLEPRWRHHRIEYSPVALLDLLHRYFGRVERPDDASLPHMEVFDALHGTGVDYLLRMNPLVCSDPIRVRSTP